MPKRRYTDIERAEAVVELEAAGYPNKKGALQKTSNKLGIPVTTLKDWFTGRNNPPPAEIRCKKTLDMRTSYEDAMLDVFGAMKTTIADASYRDLVTASGIIFDKLQILKDQPTAIVRIAGMVRSGQVKPEEVRSRWPNIADEIIREAGLPLC